MSALLDKIVDVEISIETVSASSASYSSILIVCPRTETVGENVTGAVMVSGVSGLTDLGYTSADPVYTAAQVVFSQVPSPDAVYVAPKGDDEELGKFLDQVASPSWYGLALAGYDDVADIEAAMKWTETNEKLFGFTTHSKVSEVSLQGYYRTFAVYSDKAEDSACDYISLAMMAKCFGYEPGSETWALKSLAAVPTSALTADDMNTLDKSYTSYYVSGDGVSVTQGGMVMSGEWIDVIRFRDYLKNDIKSRVFNFLIANRKVPYTDAGIAGIENQVLAALKAGQALGGIAPTEYDGENETPGYTVTVPRAYEISKVVKKSRKLPNVKFTARLAGAIHCTEVRGSLEN